MTTGVLSPLPKVARAYVPALGRIEVFLLRTYGGGPAVGGLPGLFLPDIVFSPSRMEKSSGSVKKEP